MARRLIGTGITNAQGIAIMDKDAQGNTITGYTGVGAGKLQIVAESGSLQSDTYELIDAEFLDIATTGKKNTNWNNPSSYVSVETVSDGTTLSNESSTRHYWAKNYNTFNGNFAMEVDILSYADNTNGGIRITGTNSNFIFKTYNVPQSCHLKIVFENNSLKYQIDDGELTTYVSNITDTNLYVGFRFVGAWSVKYANFMVYPI